MVLVRMLCPGSSVRRPLCSNQPRTFVPGTHPKLVDLPKKLGLVYARCSALALVRYHGRIISVFIG
jgi:hypothetical protein